MSDVHDDETSIMHGPPMAPPIDLELGTAAANPSQPSASVRIRFSRPIETLLNQLSLFHKVQGLVGVR
jgi:hypothetical protein